MIDETVLLTQKLIAELRKMCFRARIKSHFYRFTTPVMTMLHLIGYPCFSLTMVMALCHPMCIDSLANFTTDKIISYRSN
jgi:hypothetical protein